PSKSAEEGDLDEAYETMMEKKTPHFFIDFGHRGQSASGKSYLKSGSISTMDEYYSDEAYALYQPFVNALNQSLLVMGWTPCWYGAEALKIGLEGAFYAFDDRDPNLLHAGPNTWRYEDLVEEHSRINSLSARQTRIDLKATWEFMEKLGYKPPRDSDGNPRPATGDLNESNNADEAFSFFRTQVLGENLSYLSLSHTLFGKSEISLTTFRGSNLRRSLSYECDWLDCDLAETELSYANLRTCRFLFCDFSNAKLEGADLRESSFVGCNFTGANLHGVCLDQEYKETVHLSEQQQPQVNWDCPAADDPIYG
ncbi:MAG: pentapeptide repeat-containing protein, partial [Chthonomonadales bacterium]|nr:pentapeptide repeat-containing protein [Chthonomonadales bacterium]